MVDASADIRIRARLEGGVAHVQVLMPHPMETGMRVDAAGAVMPAHHITQVVVTLAGRTVFEARMSIAVSRDPLLQLRVRGAQPGQRLRVGWADSRGQARAEEITIV